MTARPSEIRAVAALLEAGDDTPESLAKAVINEVDRQREDRVQHVVACACKGGAVFAYGPYPTTNAATRAVLDGKVPMASVADRVALAELRSAEYAARSIEEL